jgi:hypothetical protein
MRVDLAVVIVALSTVSGAFFAYYFTANILQGSLRLQVSFLSISLCSVLFLRRNSFNDSKPFVLGSFHDPMHIKAVKKEGEAH